MGIRLTDLIPSRFGAAAALALAVLTAPAWAAGDNVVMISVAHVGMPAKFPGLCRVDGVVRHVWQGNAFHEGETLSLKVPCGAHANVMPLLPAGPTSGARLTDPFVLRASMLGAAHLDDAGNLMWQPANGDGRTIWGYRVLQAVRLHLSRSA
jgi:hypothetical protein